MHHQLKSKFTEVKIGDLLLIHDQTQKIAHRAFSVYEVIEEDETSYLVSAIDQGQHQYTKWFYKATNTSYHWPAQVIGLIEKT